MRHIHQSSVILTTIPDTALLENLFEICGEGLIQRCFIQQSDSTTSLSSVQNMRVILFVYDQHSHHRAINPRIWEKLCHRVRQYLEYCISWHQRQDPNKSAGEEAAIKNVVATHDVHHITWPTFEHVVVISTKGKVQLHALDVFSISGSFNPSRMSLLFPHRSIHKSNDKTSQLRSRL